MGYADELMNRIGSTQKVGRRNSLVIGKHRLALLSFQRKVSKKPGAREGRLEAEFEVVNSTAYQPGTKCSVAFFVERPNFPEYEYNRAKDLIDTCIASVSDLEEHRKVSAVFGGEMLSPAQAARGIVLDVNVVGDVDENGQPKRGKKGNQYSSEMWTVAGPQSRAEIAGNRVELDKRAPLVLEEQPQMQQAPQGYGQPQGGYGYAQPATQPQGYGQPAPGYGQPQGGFIQNPGQPQQPQGGFIQNPGPQGQGPQGGGQGGGGGFGGGRW